MSRKMFIPLLTILFLVAAARADSVESPIPTPCNMSKLKSDLDKVPFINTSSLKCSEVWKEKNFTLMFQISDDLKTWSFVLSAPTSITRFYIAIGFSKDGKMMGSSAVAGWLASDGKGTVKQYSLTGMTAASVIPDKGDLVLTSNKTIFSTPKMLYLAFQLDASTSRPSNKLLYATGLAPTSGDQLSYHEANKISTTITFTPEDNNTAPSSAPAPAPAFSGGHTVTSTIPAFSALLALLLFF